TICNTSGSNSHIIRGLTVGIAAFSSYSGTLNTYQFCDSYFQRPNGVAEAGCGGGSSFDEQLQTSFAASDTTGAQATTTQLGTGNAGSDPTAPNTPPLPVRLGPGQEIVIDLGVTPPAAVGTYTFAFGLNYDDVSNAAISTMEPTLFDGAAIK